MGPLCARQDDCANMAVTWRSNSFTFGEVEAQGGSGRGDGVRTPDWYPGGQIPEHILGTVTWGCLTFVISLRTVRAEPRA